MIISRGRRYIFVHIPKTGGTSMALALEGRAMKDDVMLGDTPKARQRRGRIKNEQSRGRLWKHSTLADIEGLVSPAEISEFFVFTLVRNPWDRVVSYYHWLCEQSFDHPAVELAKANNFTDFLHHPLTETSFRNTPSQSYVRTSEGVERCNLFIRIENHESDAVPLWDHLGFKLTLSRVNASPRRIDYRHYFNDSDAELVSQICAPDIAKFGYAF